jgi:hypothetical protein
MLLGKSILICFSTILWNYLLIFWVSVQPEIYRPKVLYKPDNIDFSPKELNSHVLSGGLDLDIKPPMNKNWFPGGTENPKQGTDK